MVLFELLSVILKDGEKVKECPVCGGEDFEFKEGCLMCTGYGFSKCS